MQADTGTAASLGADIRRWIGGVIGYDRRPAAANATAEFPLMPSRSTAPDHDEDAFPERDVQVGVGLPAVVAIVATSGGPDAVVGALEGLADQEYGNLTVVVMDAGSPDDPTRRIAAVMPDAFVRHVDGGRSFGAVCNEVLGTVEGATFLLFCHDDLRLAPGAVHAMVTEAFRANAGIVGAKIVRAEAPELLDEMGFGVDAFGFAVPVVEAGELDQAQHDAARDVFMVSTAAMLVRADLFADLGGFSPAMSPLGEALDLCWRARVAGAHVAVMPAAVGHHDRTSTLGDPTDADRRCEIRDQGRTVLVAYGAAHLVRVAPLAALLSVLDLVVSTLSGHLGRSLDIVRAWWSNVLHLPTTLATRRRTQRSRRSPDRDIRAAQLRGSGRIVTSYRSLRASTGRRIPDAIAAARGLPASVQRESTAMGVVLAVLLGILFLVGSRGLIGGGVPVVRDFLPTSGATDLLREWWGGWRQGGFVTNSATPNILAVVALCNAVLLGAAGLARTAVLLCGLPLGAWGAWRAGRDVISSRSRVAVTLAYVFVSVPYDAIAGGRWTTLIAYGTAPWVIGALARMSGVEPFPQRRIARQAATLGLVLALGATVGAAVLVMSAAMTLVVAAGLALSRQLVGARRVLRGGAVAVCIGALCSLPTTIGLVGRSDRWSVLWATTSARRPQLAELLRLSTGAGVDTVLWFAVPIVAALVIVVGRGWRLRWGTILWAVAVASWAIALVTYRWWPAGTRPDTGLVLAPAAAALAVAVGLGMESFGADVRGGAFGWRQAAASVVALIAAVAVVPFIQVAADGRWNMIDGDVVAAVQTLGHRGDTSYRTLWLGDSDALPTRSERIVGRLAFAVTRGVRPTLGSVYPAPPTRQSRHLSDEIRSALDGGMARLGERLAASGVRYVVVVTNVSAGEVVDPPPAVRATRAMLIRQLDLQSLDVAPGIDVYQVTNGRASDRSLVASRSAGVGHVLGNLISVIALAAALRTAFGTKADRRGRHDEDADPAEEDHEAEEVSG